MCVPLPHEQDTNSADTAYGIACLTILEFWNDRLGSCAFARWFAEQVGAMRGRIRKITAVALARKRLFVREPLRSPYPARPRVPNSPMAKFACRITSYESR
jgi:hypothetical protein